VKREKLQPIPYEQVVSWGFGDFVFGQGFDNVSSTIKICQAGFQECLDSEAMFAGLFERLRKMRLLPTTMFGTLRRASITNSDNKRCYAKQQA